MIENDSSNWYALHVRSKCEKLVYAQLEAKKHKAFLPIYLARHRWADRWKTVSLPLFTGYVFCQFEPAQRYSVLANSGVIDVVRAGGEPVAVDPNEMENLRRVVDSPLSVEPYPELAKGQRVVMSGGPLTGLTGTLVEIRRNLRLVLTVELLNRSISVEIERDWVVPCEPATHVPPCTSYQVAEA